MAVKKGVDSNDLGNNKLVLRELRFLSCLNWGVTIFFMFAVTSDFGFKLFYVGHCLILTFRRVDDALPTQACW